MASYYQVSQHASNTKQDASADNLAIVPYEPWQQPIPSLWEGVLAPEPISYALPAAQAVPKSTSRMRSFRAAIKSEQISMDQFTLALPQELIDHLSSKEEDMKKHKNLISCAPQEQPPTISERLQGWRCEKRMSVSNNKVDKFFYHRNKKFRSVKELKFYVKYGFVPSKSQGKRTHQTLEEAGPSRSRPNYLDHKEQELRTTFNISTDITGQVDKAIKTQLLWTKNYPKPPPATNEGTDMQLVLVPRQH